MVDRRVDAALFGRRRADVHDLHLGRDAGERQPPLPLAEALDRLHTVGRQLRLDVRIRERCRVDSEGDRGQRQGAAGAQEKRPTDDVSTGSSGAGMGATLLPVCCSGPTRTARCNSHPTGTGGGHERSPAISSRSRPDTTAAEGAIVSGVSSTVWASTDRGSSSSATTAEEFHGREPAFQDRHAARRGRDRPRVLR